MSLQRPPNILIPYIVAWVRLFNGFVFVKEWSVPEERTPFSEQGSRAILFKDQSCLKVFVLAKVCDRAPSNLDRVQWTSLLAMVTRRPPVCPQISLSETLALPGQYGVKGRRVL